MKTKTNTQQMEKQPLNFIMRPVELADAVTLADWYQQVEDISIFDRQTPVPVNGTEVSKIVDTIIADQKSQKCCWYIAQTDQGEPAGMCGLELINPLHGNAILPLFVAEPWRRTGLGIRMGCMMVDLAFKQLRLHRVSTLYRADNTATEGLIERCGFRKEGISRQAWYSNGTYHDIVNVGIIADEWETHRLKLADSLDHSVTLSLGPRPSGQWTWPPSSES